MKWFTQKARKEERDPRQEAAPANRATSALNGHVLPATEDESWQSLRNTLVTGLALDASWCLHEEEGLLWWAGPSPTLIRVHERYKLSDGIPRDTIEVVTTVAEFAGDPPSPDEQAAVYTALNVWNGDTPWSPAYMDGNVVQMRSIYSFSKEFSTNLGLILTTACYQAGWATSLYRDCASACSRLVPHAPPHPSSGIRTDYDELALTHGPGFLGRNAPARMLFDVTYLDDAATRASVVEVLRRSPSIEGMEYHESTGISVFDMVEGMTLAYGIVSPGTLPFALNSCDEAGEYVPIFEGLVAEVSLRDQLDGTACDASGRRALRELGMRLCQLFLRAHHSDEPLYGEEPGFPRDSSLYLTEETEGLYGFTLKMLVPSSALVAMARPGTPSQNGQVLASLLGALMFEAYCAHGFITAAREASSGPQ